MLADSEIPVRVTDPRHLEIILKTKLQIQIVPLTQLIKDDAIINSFDPHVVPLMIVE